MCEHFQRVFLFVGLAFVALVGGKSFDIKFEKGVVNANDARSYSYPVQGNFSQFFFYYTTIEVGIPPLPFTVILDTGSSDLLIPSVSCLDCYGGNPSKYYNSSNSLTYTPVMCYDPFYKCNQTACSPTDSQCRFEPHFVGFFEQATLVNDYVTLGELKSYFAFGAITSINMYSSQILLAIEKLRQDTEMNSPEGLLGLAFQSLSAVGALPLIDSFASTHQIDNVFSFCFNKIGGTLTLGTRSPYHTTPYQYTPIIQESQQYYNVKMLDVRVNGVSIGVNQTYYNSTYTIIDSGTPLPTLTIPAFTALQNLILSNCSRSNLYGVCEGVSKNGTLFDQVCYLMSPEQISQFPVIQFVLQGLRDEPELVLDYGPSSYLQYQYFCDDPLFVGFGIDSDPQFTVLGAELLLYYATVFDRENFVIGFSPVSSNCP